MNIHAIDAIKSTLSLLGPLGYGSDMRSSRMSYNRPCRDEGTTRGLRKRDTHTVVVCSRGQDTYGLVHRVPTCIRLSFSQSLDHTSSPSRRSPCGLSSALALNPPPKPMTVINIANTPKNLNTPLSFLISSPPSSPSPPLPPPCVDPDPGERPPNG
jgi:hypothetical protein